MMVGVSALTGGSMMYASHLKNQTNMVAAQQMKDVSRVFERYVTDNYAQLLSDAAVTGWARVPMDALQPQYLNNAFLNKNAFGQEYVLAVRQPAPDVADLEAVVFTDGGEEIPPDRALSIAQAVGASGGFTLKGGSPTQVRATFDGYNLDLSNFGDAAPTTAGKLVSAIFVNEIGSLSMDYLYRKEIHGRPELNRMYTNLDMNENDIEAIKHVSAQTANISDHLESGDISASGQIEAGTDIIATMTLKGKEVQAEVDVRAGRDLIADRNLSAGGTVKGNTLVPTLVVAPNSFCTGYETGSVAKTSTGKLLSCQSGVWKEASSGDFGGAYRFTHPYDPIKWYKIKNNDCLPARQRQDNQFLNPVTGTCSCPPGYGYHVLNKEVLFGNTGGDADETYIRGYAYGIICMR